LGKGALILGYYPYDTRLFDIYEFCQQAKLSVIAHGSPNGPVHFKGSYNELYDLLGVRKDARRALRHLDKKQLCRFFTDPVNYSIILSKFPKLHICLAHFGGQDWARYLNNDKIDNWVSVLLSMIDKFDNLYTDISYTMSNEDYWPIFKLMLIDNPKLRQRVLFGSDFYMNEVEGEEKVWSIKFRVFLGEELFTQIAVTNPKVFLHEQNEV
jgi:predicted TIM-barrel fold metal-dependent hydrolase